MIIIMKPQATEEQIGALCDSLGKQGMHCLLYTSDAADE